MTNTTPEDIEPELTAEVTGTGRASRTSYDIAPEHQHHADAILAMDPIADVPRPYEIPEGWAANLTLRATALPPKMQREVTDQLAALGDLTPEQRSAKEAEFTAAAIRSQRQRLIVQGGVGKDATPYHREMAGIAREVQDLFGQYEHLQGELSRVIRHDTMIDPATGEPKAVPVYALSEERQRAYAGQQQDLLRRMRLLVNDDGTPGIEGTRRMRQALVESVEARVELARQIAEEAEVKRLAVEINRDKRIRARAEARARHIDNGG